MINENRVAARTLVIAAHDFLVEYIKHDDWGVGHHELAHAAVAAVFSASFVDAYYKHELLGAVHDKIQPGRQLYPHPETMQADLENEAAARDPGTGQDVSCTPSRVKHLKMSDPKNYHTNAAALIIAAAVKSGFLDEVAQVLCHNSKHSFPYSSANPADQLVDDLVELFDNNCTLPASALKCSWMDGENLDILNYDFKTFPDDVIAPFRGVEVTTTEDAS